MSFTTDLANGVTRFRERDEFFCSFYDRANAYEEAKTEDTKSALMSFLKKNVDSLDLITLISYNIANNAYPHTRALVDEIMPALTKICEHRKALELLTA